MLIRGIETTDFYELQDWCVSYHHTCNLQSVSIRFGIGVYQITQAIRWEGTKVLCEDESYAAAALHFIITAKLLNADISGFFLPDVRVIEPIVSSWKEIIYNIGKVHQQITYHISRDYRSSRYSVEQATNALQFLVRKMISMISPNKRKEAFFLATEILSKV